MRSFGRQWFKNGSLMSEYSDSFGSAVPISSQPHGRLAQWNGVEETFSRLETQIAQLTWEMQEWNALETV